MAVSSGMAAISLALFGTLGQGDHVVASRECYCDTRTLLTENFARFGVTASFVDPADIRSWRDAVTPRTRLVLAETISNPGMELADLPALSAVAHDAGAVLLVDNTFATPALCRPLEHGADLVAHSAGKLLGGHHDVTSGVLLGTRRLLDPIRRVAYLTGPVLAPMEAWLTLRGIKTLAPRMAWVSQTAVAVARFLRGHPAVGVVRYPGDPDGARAALTRRLLPGGAGGLMTFDLTGGCGAADDFFKGLRMIPYAATVGGTSTIVSYPPRAVAGDAQRNGDLRTHRCATVRVSIGLEDPVDIVADLRRALDRAGVPAAAGRGAAGGAAS
ncbi:MAG: trans-sulfuration enzyme family protein [Thermomicrobiales bacterium]